MHIATHRKAIRYERTNRAERKTTVTGKRGNQPYLLLSSGLCPYHDCDLLHDAVAQHRTIKRRYENIV
jgi:hypothetical protein